MRKSIKKLLGTALTAAMCLSLLPTQMVKAEEDKELITLSEEEAKELLFGTWAISQGTDGIVGETTLGEQAVIDVNGEERTYYLYSVSASYNDKRIEVYATYVTDIEKHAASLEGDEEKGTYHKDGRFRMEYGSDSESWFLATMMGNNHSAVDDDYDDLEKYFSHKILENGEAVTGEELLQILNGTSKEETEEDVTAETKEDAKTDAKEEPKTENKTVSGRELKEGESLYIVKKGDCLWSIARTLLGDGRKYTELYTRNNDIVEKATLIFPGQEIIVPAK